MNIVKQEPVLTAGTISGIIIALAAIFVPSIDASTIETAIAAILPILAAFTARQHVEPVA